MTTITRFAPSPTGYLHVGGARTALYSWLYARKNKGKFILRIEDTDLERSTVESVQAIFDSMAWLGLNADEEPVFQTERFDRYKEVIQQMLDKGLAYKCYCSRERLDNLREEQMANKQKPKYDGHCRNLDDSENSGDYVVRFKNPQEGDVIIDDAISGQIVINNRELDDLIIARTDGSPTYNFTVVVDDMDMQITDVIRGADHINNTPRQINIFKALGADVPRYAHVPMILGDDGKKLSKRHGAVGVMQYRDDGYLPEALLNYLVRLGWSSGDQEIFSLDEMIEKFDLNSVSKSAAAFNTEKLQWLNQHYIKTLPAEYVATELAHCFDLLGVDIADGPSLELVVDAQKERAKTLKEMAEKSRFWFEDIASYDEKAAKKNLKPDAAEVLLKVRSGLDVLSSWVAENIQEVIDSLVEDEGLKMGKVAQPIRVAITGSTVSPSIGVTLSLLPKEKVLSRIDRAVDFCKSASL